MGRASRTITLFIMHGPSAMNSKQQNQVFKFSAVVLLITAFAKLYSSAGSVKILAVKDPLLHLGYRPLLVSVSVVEIVVAIFIIVSSNDLKRCIALLWLSGNFLFYHLGNYAMGIHLCPCLGNLTDRLPLSTVLVHNLYKRLF